jgi:hypothetical protein
MVLLLAMLVAGCGPFGQSSHPQPSRASGTPAAQSGCNPQKTSAGYLFSWLHVADGVIMDASNCIVDLKGFNWAGIEFGDAVGGGPNTRISQEAIAWFAQTFHTNIWRIPLNTSWWNANVDVPLAGMHYQAWIQQIVRWAEQNGNYVLLTKGPQFTNLPCGGQVTFCPSQNQGSKNAAQHPSDPALQQQLANGQYIDAAVQMWTSVAQLYANDPAILYDSWNEMHDISPQTWQRNENVLINTIRAQSPRAVVLLGGPNWKGNITALITGVVSLFAQPNLVYDFHVYNGYQGTYNGMRCNEPNSYLWQDWPSHADEQIGFAQQHGSAVAISEWGGSCDLATYNQAITSYGRTHHVLLTYYEAGNVAAVHDGQYQLNANGMLVQAAYLRY